MELGGRKALCGRRVVPRGSVAVVGFSFSGHDGSRAVSESQSLETTAWPSRVQAGGLQAVRHVSNDVLPYTGLSLS